MGSRGESRVGDRTGVSEGGRAGTVWEGGNGLKRAVMKPKDKGSKWEEAATCNSCWVCFLCFLFFFYPI